MHSGDDMLDQQRTHTDQAFMESKSMTDQILGVVQSHCSPAFVSRLLNDLRSAQSVEHRMMRASKRVPRPVLSLIEQDKLDRLITLCDRNLAAATACTVLVEIGDVFKSHGDHARAEEMYNQALVRGEHLEENESMAEAYMRRGEMYSRKGQWKQSGADLGKSRAILTALKRNDLVGRVENILGTNYAEQGKLKQAATLFASALKRYERSRESSQVGTVLMNLGIVHNIIGEYDSALTYYKRAQSCYEDVGDLNRLAEIHHNIGMTYLSMERYNGAIREFNAGYLLSSRMQNVSLMGLSSLGKANAYFYQGDLPMALKLVSQAIEGFAGSSDRLSLADAYKIKGMIHREMGRFESADSYLETSLRINRELRNLLNEAETYFEMAALKLKQKKKKEAMSLLVKARSGFRKVGALEEEKKTEGIIKSTRNGRQ
jgi:tetratricopeptide (TPR) repeat protein